MATPIKFTREVTMQPYEITTAMKNRGVPRFEMDLLFTVRASLGAVVLKLRLKNISTGGIMVGEGTYQPHNLSSHYYRRVRGREMLEDANCDVLGTDVCFGDTGFSVAGDAWAAFMRSEEEGWKFLEDTYNEWRKPEGASS